MNKPYIGLFFVFCFVSIQMFARERKIDTLAYIPDEDEYNLVVSAIKGDIPTAKSLIDKGINVNTSIDENMTPLVYAAMGGQEKMIVYLIGKGAEVNYRATQGPTPLVAAVRSKHRSIVDLLISKGAEIDIPDANGRTPLMYSILSEDTLLFEKFIKAGADIHHKDTTGIDVLMSAVINDQKYFVQKLIELGATADTYDENNVTPLMVAVSRGDIEMATILLDNKADINHKSHNQQTALTVAIENMDEQMVDFLIKRGADVNQKLTFAEKPSTVANYFNVNAFIKDALYSAGAKKTWLPDYRKFVAGPLILGNMDELFTGIEVGLKDYRYNSDLLLGFIIRPFPIRVQADFEGRTYQFWEGRSAFFLGIEKRLALIRKANDQQLGFLFGAKGAYTFGNYRGTTLDFENSIVPMFNAGVYVSNRYLQIGLSYVYTNFKAKTVSNNRMELSVRLYLGKAFNFSKNDYSPW
ncbi:MAG TPA: ankyrin repeat domain-containing protein [Bacteroidales bacterium]|nr:ankyrin repeat domain-containing protein [Bacteroidales bacterium]